MCKEIDRQVGLQIVDATDVMTMPLVRKVAWVCMLSMRLLASHVVRPSTCKQSTLPGLQHAQAHDGLGWLASRLVMGKRA